MSLPRALIVAALVAPFSPALAEPVLNSTIPYGFQRGTSVPVTFNGNRLNEPNIRLLCYSDGITMAEFASEKPASGTAMLTVDEAVPVGLHAFRLVSDRGISGLRTIYVGALPRVDEVEPNDNSEAAQVISPDCTVAGVSLVRDEDWFQVEVPEGWRRLSVEVHGIRLGNQFYDPVLEVHGPDGALLKKSDDTALCRQDPFIVVPNPSPGTYRILLRDAMYRGAGNYWYLLHVGQFPRPVFSLPSGGPAGSPIELAWFNEEREAFRQLVEIPVDSTGTIDLSPADEFGIAPSPVPFHVGSVSTRESEPNNNHNEANPVAWPLVIESILADAGDADFFKFTAKKGQAVRFAVHSRQEVRSPVDAVVTLLNPQGGYIASNDDSGGPDSVLEQIIPEDGDYFVSVRDFLRRGGPGYRYRLHITTPPQRVGFSLPERARNRSITVAVPSGNRMAVLVQTNRVGIGGEVNLQLADLPQGTTFESPTLSGDRGRVPLLLSAAADAEPAAVLCKLTGSCGAAEQMVEGSLAQRQLLVAGDNNRDMWGYDMQRLAVAVTDAAPFKIDLIPPKVPIVQRGVMSLKIVATRDAGFDAPITIQSLYMPPGLSGKGTVTIPEKATSIDYALNANDKARVGVPSFVVLARAPHQGANVEVTSALVPITVATPYVGVKSHNVSLAQGGQCESKIALTVNRPFEGMATAELLNLPHGVSAETVTFAADQQELLFVLTAAADARIGRKGGIICRIVVTQHEEPITHMIPVGQVRVDPPATSVAGSST